MLLFCVWWWDEFSPVQLLSNMVALPSSISFQCLAFPFPVNYLDIFFQHLTCVLPKIIRQKHHREVWWGWMIVWNLKIKISWWIITWDKAAVSRYLFIDMCIEYKLGSAWLEIRIVLFCFFFFQLQLKDDHMLYVQNKNVQNCVKIRYIIS